MVFKGPGGSGGDDDSDCDPKLATLGHLAAVDPNLAVVIKDPLRVQIVALGHQRLISPSEFAEEAGISVRESSGHFKALRDADYLELIEEVKVRGAVRHMYRSTKRAYFSVIDWSKLGKKVQDGTGTAVLADFTNRLTEAFDAGTFQERPDSVLFWLGMALDEQSWPEYIEILTWAIKEIEELNVSTANRHAEGNGKGKLFPVTFQIAGFESPSKPVPKKTKKTSKPKQAKKKAKSKGTAKSKRQSKRKSAKKGGGKR